MPASDILRYGLRYLLAYAGILALLFAGATLLALVVTFRPVDLSLGALIGAALLTQGRFLRDRMRLPTRGEYWALVLASTAVVVVVEATLGALVLGTRSNPGLDLFAALILIGLPLLKGLVLNGVFYSKNIGARTLDQIRKSPESGPAMPVREALGHALRYALVYLALLALVVACSLAAASLFGVRYKGNGFEAAVLATLIVHALFIRRKLRLASTREYASLVLWSTLVLVLVDFATAVVGWRLTRPQPLDGTILSIFFALPLATGLLVTTVLYARFVGRPYLRRVLRRREIAAEA